IDLLLDAPFRALPVVDEHGLLQGIISSGDLIKAGILPVRRGIMRTALALDSLTAEAVEAPLGQARQSKLLAQDIMNRQVQTIEPSRSLREAATIMIETGVRRLPVVESNGMLVGMLSRADLLQAVVTSPLASSSASSATQPLRRTGTLSTTIAQQQPVADYMNPDVVTIGEDALLAEVIDALTISPLKRVIVVDQERHVKGIISDVDMLAHIQEEERPGLLTMLVGWARGKPGRLPTSTLRTPHGKARVAADMMNRNVVTVTETTSVQATIESMIATGRKVLPVLNSQGQLVGVVGRSDLLRILLEG
ncbi:MAG: CBS domain-containing protein, partial [Chloroflexota bacterium]|nr:CBS domain-containing protein [Chloroflexota bacterium]